MDAAARPLDSLLAGIKKKAAAETIFCEPSLGMIHRNEVIA